jgi:hypothetical protein
VAFGVWVVVFLFVCVFSLMFVDSTDHAIQQAMRYFWTLGTGVCFALFIQTDRRLIRYVHTGILFGVLLLCSVNYLEFTNPEVRIYSSASNYIEDQQQIGVVSRIGGLHVNPNANGFALVLSMFVTYFFVPSGLRFLFTIIVGLAVMATVSRSAIIVWLVACIVLYTRDYVRSSKRARFFGTMTVVLLVMGSLFSGKIPEYLSNIGVDHLLNENMKMRLSGNFFSQEDMSSEVRDELAKNAVSNYMDNPIIGTGLGSSAPIGSQGTHNLIAKIGVELGIVGLFVFFGGLYFMAFAFRNWYGLLFLVIFTIASLFTHNLIEWAYFSILLVSMLVLVPYDGLSRVTNESQNNRKRKRRRKYVRKKRI